MIITQIQPFVILVKVIDSVLHWLLHIHYKTRDRTCSGAFWFLLVCQSEDSRQFLFLLTRKFKNIPF